MRPMFTIRISTENIRALQKRVARYAKLYARLEGEAQRCVAPTLAMSFPEAGTVAAQAGSLRTSLSAMTTMLNGESARLSNYVRLVALVEESFVVNFYRHGIALGNITDRIEGEGLNGGDAFAITNLLAANLPGKVVLENGVITEEALAKFGALDAFGLATKSALFLPGFIFDYQTLTDPHASKADKALAGADVAVSGGQAAARVVALTAGGFEAIGVAETAATVAEALNPLTFVLAGVTITHLEIKLMKQLDAVVTDYDNHNVAAAVNAMIAKLQFTYPGVKVVAQHGSITVTVPDVNGKPVKIVVDRG